MHRLLRYLPAALVLFVGLSNAAHAQIDTRKLAAPEFAPAWQLQTPAGKTVNFPEDANGKPTVLLFWPSWCPFSRALQPYVQDIWEDYGTRINVWTINILENGDPVQTLKDRGLSFPLLLKGDALRNSYKIQRTPWLVVINAKNRIVYTRPPQPPTPIHVAKKVRTTLNQLLGEQAVALPTSYPEPYTLHLKGRGHSSALKKPKPAAPTSAQWQAWLQDYLKGINPEQAIADEPARGAVTSGKAAITIAREIWTARYGKKLMIEQAPHRAYRQNNIWVVIGTTGSGQIGDGLILAITADEGRVLQASKN